MGLIDWIKYRNTRCSNCGASLSGYDISQKKEKTPLCVWCFKDKIDRKFESDRIQLRNVIMKYLETENSFEIKDEKQATEFMLAITDLSLSKLVRIELHSDGFSVSKA